MKKHPRLKITLSVLLTIVVIWGIIAILPRPKSYIGTNPLRKETNSQPLLIAHAGGIDEFPGNTLEAFYNAYSIDPNCLMETDVNMTKDGELILIHDNTLDRTTNLTNKKVIDVNYSDLIADEVDFSYDYYDGVKGKYRNYLNESVTPVDVIYPLGVTPRHNTKFLATKLEELIKAFPNNLISVEIKQEGEVGLQALARTIELLDDLDEQYNTYNRIVLASFNEEIYQELVNLKNTTHPNLMYSPQTNGVIKFFALQFLKLDVFYNDSISVLQIPMSNSGINLSTKSLISAAHKHNIAVHYWTINNEEDMRTLIELGADGIMSDRPTLLKEVIDEYYN